MIMLFQVNFMGSEWVIYVTLGSEESLVIVPPRRKPLK